MVHGEIATVVGVHQRERGRGHRFGNAEGGSNALGKHRFSRTHFTGQHDGVAASNDPRESGREVARVARGCRSKPHIGNDATTAQSATPLLVVERAH